jgi:hypothetical protein
VPNHLFLDSITFHTTLIKSTKPIAFHFQPTLSNLAPHGFSTPDDAIRHLRHQNHQDYLRFRQRKYSPIFHPTFIINSSTAAIHPSQTGNS